MALLREREDHDTNLGEWETFGPDPDNGKPVRFRIRFMPEAKENAIARHHRIQFRVKKGAAIFDAEYQERSERANTEAACWAVTGSENFSGRAEDEGGAGLYSQLLGISVEVGKDVLFDANLTEKLKEHLFGNNPSLARWCVTKSQKGRAKAAEEEGKDDET